MEEMRRLSEAPRTRSILLRFAGLEARACTEHLLVLSIVLLLNNYYSIRNASFAF